MVRVRVYELAKELGIPSVELLAKLNGRGAWTRSASEVIDPAVVRAVRAEHSSEAHPPGPKRAVAVESSWRTDSWDYDDDYRDRDELITAEQASRELSVQPATIRKWVARGYLNRSGTQGRAALYRRRDIQTASYTTRRRANPPPPLRTWPAAVLRYPMTTAQAAKLAGVTESTIRMWVKRGHLRPTRREGRRNVYDAQAVLRAALRRRRS